MGYMPVMDDKRLELIGTAGVTWTKATIDETPLTYKATETDIGFRIGGGAQYAITDQINARGLLRYQTADFDDIADHAWTYSFGVNYKF